MQLHSSSERKAIISSPPYCTINSPPPPAGWLPPTGPRSRGKSGPSRATSHCFRPSSQPPKFRPTVPEFSVPQFFRFPTTAAPHRLHQDRFQFGRNFRNSMIEMKLKCGQVTYVRIRFGIGSVDQADA